MADSLEYTPPKVWTWNKPSGGAFASINRPVAGRFLGLKPGLEEAVKDHSAGHTWKSIDIANLVKAANAVKKSHESPTRTVFRLISAEAIAVGTPVTGRPPHRSRRARFAHRAPTLGA
jgi:hypothetical protein